VIDLRWDGHVVHWSIANQSNHTLLIEDPTAVGSDMRWLETPLGVGVRVADDNGVVMPNDIDDEGWWSPIWLSSSLPPAEPPRRRLNPNETLHYVLDPRRLVTGLREHLRPTTVACRVQVRGLISDPDGRTWALQTEWKDMPCAELFSDWQRS
jgi:hypothetical protein